MVDQQKHEKIAKTRILTKFRNIVSETEEIDYARVKFKYLKLMQDEYKHDILSDSLFTANSITEAIEELKCLKNSSSESDDSELAKKYDIVNIADPNSPTDPKGRYILTLLNNPSKQVLSYEDSFDVFYEVYRYKFPNRSKLTLKEMRPFVEENYCVSEVSLKTFIKCLIEPKLTEEKDEKLKFNDKVELHFMDIRHCPDNNFRFVLIYYDVATSFLLLRPILEINEQEIASELYEIFINFGSPKIILNSSGISINDVISLLNTTPMKYDCVIVNTGVGSNPILKRVTKEFQYWLNYKNLNWAIGCSVIQYSMNSSNDLNSYSLVYGQKTKTPNYVENIDKVMDLDTGNLTDDPDVRNKDKDKTVQTVLCHHCHCDIWFKSFMCHLCKHSFHLVCVNRTVVDDTDAFKSKITCFTCDYRTLTDKNDVKETE